MTRGVGRYFPEAHERFLTGLPPRDLEGNLAAAYRRLLASPDRRVRDAAAVAWCQWEEAIKSVDTDPVPGVWTNPRYADADFRYGFARTVTHYWGNAAFQSDDAILGRLDRLAGIPALLCHGRLDLAGPADVAWEVARGWPGADLHVVPGVGHLGSAAMNALMVAATDHFAALRPAQTSPMSRLRLTHGHRGSIVVAFSTGPSWLERRPPRGARSLTRLDSTGQACPLRVDCRFALPPARNLRPLERFVVPRPVPLPAVRGEPSR